MIIYATQNCCRRRRKRLSRTTQNLYFGGEWRGSDCYCGSRGLAPTTKKSNRSASRKPFVPVGHPAKHNRDTEVLPAVVPSPCYFEHTSYSSKNDFKPNVRSLYILHPPDYATLRWLLRIQQPPFIDRERNSLTLCCPISGKYQHTFRFSEGSEGSPRLCVVRRLKIAEHLKRKIRSVKLIFS